MEHRQTARTQTRNNDEIPLLSPTVSIVLSFVFLILSWVLIYNMVKSISTAYQRNELLAQAEKEVDELRMRNLELLEKLDYVSSPGYVEQQARDQLQYAKDGETMVLLPGTGKAESQVLGEEDESDENDTVVENSTIGWDRWWNVLLHGV